MAQIQRKYDHEYKIQAVKLAREIGGAKTSKELSVPVGISLYTICNLCNTAEGPLPP